MADNRKSYNAILRVLKLQHGLNQAQARVAWRTIKERLDRTPRAVDLKRHPRITREEVKRAPARERAARAAKTRAAKPKTAPPKAPPKAPPAKKPPKTKAVGAGGGGGGGGEISAPARAEYPPEFEGLDEYFDDAEQYYPEEEDY